MFGRRLRTNTDSGGAIRGSVAESGATPGKPGYGQVDHAATALPGSGGSRADRRHPGSSGPASRVDACRRRSREGRSHGNRAPFLRRPAREIQIASKVTQPAGLVRRRRGDGAGPLTAVLWAAADPEAVQLRLGHHRRGGQRRGQPTRGSARIFPPRQQGRIGMSPSTAGHCLGRRIARLSLDGEPARWR